MTERLLDPTAELNPSARATLPRLATLNGKTVGFLDINKPRGDVFLDRLQVLFEERGVTVRRYSKPTMTRVAPEPVKAAIAQECDAVLEALAD